MNPLLLELPMKIYRNSDDGNRYDICGGGKYGTQTRMTPEEIRDLGVLCCEWYNEYKSGRIDTDDG